MTFTAEPGAPHTEVDHACLLPLRDAVADTLWTRRLDLWGADSALQEALANQGGILDAIAAVDCY